MAKQGPWPRIAPSPPACTATPDGFLVSDRPLAGPLRLGTAPGSVGPRGRAGDGDSDFGMDRLEQRPVDRIGVKYPETDPPVRLIATEQRRDRRR
jgi:hypothetical protein